MEKLRQLRERGVLEEGGIVDNRLKAFKWGEAVDCGTSCAGRESFARYLQKEWRDIWKGFQRSCPSAKDYDMILFGIV